MPITAKGGSILHAESQVTRIYARLTDKTREDEYFKAMAIIEAGRL
jgi:hypothetical protein